MATWKRFSDILNTWGPAKSPSQWKSCFNYMKTRIRNKVEMIRQSGAKLEDNLSELDLKIHNLASAVDYALLNEELNNLDDPIYTNEDAIVHEIPNTNKKQKKKMTDIDSRGILVFESAEDLDEYVNEPIIIEDLYTKDTSDETIYIDDTNNRSDIRGISKESLNGRENDRGRGRCNIKQATTSLPKFSKNLAKQAMKTANAIKTTKTNVKIPDIQKERLIQLVQNDYLKAFGRFAGANCVYLKAQFWENVAEELNALGPARAAEQWRTTFKTIQCSAKEKLADNHNNEIGQVGRPLTRLEEKIVSVVGLDIMDGNQLLEEAGFNNRKAVPTTRVHNSILNKRNVPQVCSTVTSGTFARLSQNIDYEQTLNQESCSSLPQISQSEELETRNDNMIVISDDYDGNDDAHNSVITSNDLNASGQSIDEQRRREESVLNEILHEIWNDAESNTNPTQTLDISRQATDRRTFESSTASAANGNRSISRRVISATTAQSADNLPTQVRAPSKR